MGRWASLKCRKPHPARSRRMRTSNLNQQFDTRLLFGLELAVVFGDERLDFSSAGKNAKPLFFV